MEEDGLRLRLQTLAHSFRWMARQRVSALVAQHHGGSGFVPRRTENASLNSDLTARHGESVNHFWIVDHSEFPLVLRFVRRAINAFADFADDSFRFSVMRHHAVAQMKS